MTKEGSHQWLENMKPYVNKSNDRYAALVSKIIDQNLKQQNSSEPLPLKEFTKLPISQALQRLKPSLGNIEKLDEGYYEELRSGSIKFL